MNTLEAFSLLLTLGAFVLAMRSAYAFRRHVLAQARVHDMLESAESWEEFGKAFQDYAKNANPLERPALRQSLQLLLQLQYLQRKTIRNHPTLSQEDLECLRGKEQENTND